MTRQFKLLGVPRSSYDHKPTRKISLEDEILMQAMDRIYMEELTSKTSCLLKATSMLMNPSHKEKLRQKTDTESLNGRRTSNQSLASLTERSKISRKMATPSSAATLLPAHPRINQRMIALKGEYQITNSTTTQRTLYREAEQLAAERQEFERKIPERTP